MTSPRHTCPATRVGLPCWHTSATVATSSGPRRHFTFGALVELLHDIGDVASAIWESMRRGGDFVYGGVEYRRTVTP